MPHSPRAHEGRVWLLNSGTGDFGTVDLAAGRFEPVAFCPGYIRELAIVGDYAVIGLSRPRQNQAFSGLLLDDRLKERNAEPWAPGPPVHGGLALWRHRPLASARA